MKADNWRAAPKIVRGLVAAARVPRGAAAARRPVHRMSHGSPIRGAAAAVVRPGAVGAGAAVARPVAARRPAAWPAAAHRVAMALHQRRGGRDAAPSAAEVSRFATCWSGTGSTWAAASMVAIPEDKLVAGILDLPPAGEGRRWPRTGRAEWPR